MFQIPERKKKYVILAHGSIQLKISALQAVHLQLDSRFGSVSVQTRPWQLLPPCNSTSYVHAVVHRNDK